MTRLLGTLALLAVFGGCLALHCSEDDVKRCLEPMHKHHKHLKRVPELPTYGKKILEQICQDWDVAERCLSAMENFCDVTVRNLFQGVKDANRFICHEGKRRYLRFHNCFHEDHLRHEAVACNGTYALQISSIKRRVLHDAMPRTSARDYVCRYTRSAVRCVDLAVRRHCGLGAARWYQTLATKELTPLMRQSGCSGLPWKVPARGVHQHRGRQLDYLQQRLNQHMRPNPRPDQHPRPDPRPDQHARPDPRPDQHPRLNPRLDLSRRLNPLPDQSRRPVPRPNLPAPEMRLDHHHKRPKHRLAVPLLVASEEAKHRIKPAGGAEWPVFLSLLVVPVAVLVLAAVLRVVCNRRRDAKLKLAEDRSTLLPEKEKIPDDVPEKKEEEIEARIAMF